MKKRKGCLFLLIIILMFLTNRLTAQVSVGQDQKSIQIISAGKTYTFSLEMMVLYSKQDPKLALKPSGIKKVVYNVPTWITNDSSLADYRSQKVSQAMGGDGFDDKILRGKNELRTANIYHAGEKTYLYPKDISVTQDSITVDYSAKQNFLLSAKIYLKASPYPSMQFTLVPLRDGYYSVGYLGAPEFQNNKVKESWQSLIWTEHRTPDKPYLTPSFLTTLPTTFVNDGTNTIGVLASPEYIPFQPLPLFTNSQFGVALLTDSFLLKPQIFAPILGGFQSKMKKYEKFSFAYYLIVEPQSLENAYEKVARAIYGFKSYRDNAIVSMNTTLDNLIDYVKTHYAWFVDSLKGFAYSTDVPGAVKNVSSLNPLEMSIVRDDKDMFDKRAYPLMEFMLSREKFLFSLDSNQKIQSPSRKLLGPIAPISELSVLYHTFGEQNSFYVNLAKKEFNKSRVRNLDAEEKGKNWMNALFLFEMTRDSGYLELCEKLVDVYLKERTAEPADKFGDPLNNGHFFWTSYTAAWSALLELYELTGNKRYLDAAHNAARYFALFVWMIPKIPDSLVTVNIGGKAPVYDYLKNKGHKQMFYPEETIPAWRLSEIGLTAESSGTATGHRGIFMSTFAPWFLKIGYYTKDTFLIDIAKNSLVGRSESFPGYHMNTARTTAYEKVDFPLHDFMDLSVNSFHYNHILPMASIFLDYLVSDAFLKSKGKIYFPSEYIESYAYMQNKFYGVDKGTFYNYDSVQLWMPSRLLKIDNKELNYIAAKKNDTLLIAFTNQSNNDVKTVVTVNSSLVNLYRESAISKIDGTNSVIEHSDSTFSVSVPANGITAIVIKGVDIHSTFQDKILSPLADNSKDFLNIPQGHTKAYLFKLGEYMRKLYVYLEDDDNKWTSVQLKYKIGDEQEKFLTKQTYPFEFTVDDSIKAPIKFSLQLTNKEGKEIYTKEFELGEMRILKK